MQPASEAIPKRRRPWYLTWLTVLVLFFALLNLLRMLAALRQWSYLKELPLSVAPLYLALSGAFWFAAGLPLAIGLWFGRRWARTAAWIAGLMYLLYYWVDRVWLAQPQTLATRWPFALMLSIGLLIFLFVTLWVPRGKAYFRR